MAFPSGVNTRSPIFAAGTAWSTVAAVPSSASAPAVGSVTTLTLASASPSLSAKLNSSSAKVCAVSSSVVTDAANAVGAALAARFTVTV